MADSIRIEDLREPVHSDAAAAAIEMVAGLPGSEMRSVGGTWHATD